MTARFFKAPPEAESPIAWPQAGDDGNQVFLLHPLDRAADPDGSGSGFDWYCALGDSAEIDDWADGQPLEEVPAEMLPNPLSNYPAELIDALPAKRLPPNYQVFWDLLLISPVYQDIRLQALENPLVLVACTEFIAAFADAKNGRPNRPAIQACIANLFAAGTFTPQTIEGLQQLLVVAHLDSLFTISAIV
jgi:hypothetical protein